MIFPPTQTFLKIFALYNRHKMEFFSHIIWPFNNQLMSSLTGTFKSDNLHIWWIMMLVSPWPFILFLWSIISHHYFSFHLRSHARLHIILFVENFLTSTPEVYKLCFITWQFTLPLHLFWCCIISSEYDIRHSLFRKVGFTFYDQ